MSVVALSEGTFTVDLSKKLIPFNRESDSLNERKGSLLIEICPFLIISNEGLIILDTGLGKKTVNGEFQIIENLSRAGINSTDINFVLLSHLHHDHAGGICYEENGIMNPMFPNAQYVFQKEELNDALKDGNPKSFNHQKLEFLSHWKNSHAIESNTQLTPEIYCEVSGGHTEHHQVFWIKVSENEKYFFGGDVLPQGSQLIRKFIAKYDYDGKRAADLRIEFGKKCAEENVTLLFFHSPEKKNSKVKFNEGRFELIANS